MGNVGKSCPLLRDFSKRWWKSALFTDFHGRGIFHQAISESLIQYSFSTAYGIPSNLSHSVLCCQNGALS